MKRKRHSPEAIIRKLREADAQNAQSKLDDDRRFQLHLTRQEMDVKSIRLRIW